MSISTNAAVEGRRIDAAGSVAFDRHECTAAEAEDARGSMDRVMHIDAAVDPRMRSDRDAVRRRVHSDGLECCLTSGTDREEVCARTTAAVHARASGTDPTQVGDPVERKLLDKVERGQKVAEVPSDLRGDTRRNPGGRCPANDVTRESGVRRTQPVRHDPFRQLIEDGLQTGTSAWQRAVERRHPPFAIGDHPVRFREREKPLDDRQQPARLRHQLAASPRGPDRQAIRSTH